MDQIINLNFLEINPQNFSFSVFRKDYEKEDIGIKVHRYKLPLEQGSNENYQFFSVSFDEKEGFTEFICDEKSNIELTEKYLFRLILEKIINLSIEHNVGKKFYDKNIDIILKHYEKGCEIISLQPYYLKQTEKFGFLIDFRFKVKEGYSLDREILKLSLSLGNDYRSNKKYYSDTYQKYQTFISSIFKNINNFSGDGINFIVSSELAKIESQKLGKKVYRFKNERTDVSQFQGIKKYGAYETIQEDIIYVFIFEDKFKDFANNLFFSLIGKSNPGTFSGMNQFFSLPFSNSNVKKIRLENYDKENILQAIEQIKKIKNEQISKKIIAIFLEPNRFEQLKPTESPYYIFKYYLTKNDIPLQVVRDDQTNNASALKWSTSNIALQIFAKMGGIPWKVQPTKNNCLILGIGSAHERNEDGTIKKFFAYSVCLDSSGIYRKLDVLAEELTKEQYLEKLHINLTLLLQSSEFKQYKKCALHLSESIKKEDITSIEKSLSEINEIEFKVLKINVKNKFFGFSNHNTHVPYESSYIKLSGHEYLIWFDGLIEGKENIYQKVGNPVHIKFLNTPHEDTESNLNYLQDAINLSGANWRGFNAKQMPISIYYAKIVADYTTVFSQFEDFDKEVFSNNLPWFL